MKILLRSLDLLISYKYVFLDSTIATELEVASKEFRWVVPILTCIL